MNAKLIVINGQTYHSVDEMPPDVRQKYEQAMSALGDANDNHIPDALEALNIFGDKNENGVPDVMEYIASSAVTKDMKIIVGGKEVDGIENLPPEARARYAEAMGKLDANRNGIPDVVEGMLKATNQTANIPPGLGAEMPPRSTPLPVNSTITPDTTNGWMLALAGLFVILLCVAGAAGVWYFFLR